LRVNKVKKLKLVLQITLGVFLGSLASQFTVDAWHDHKASIAKEMAEKQQVKQEKIRKEQGERIRNLILQNRQGNFPSPSKPPIGFVPDDAK
jgi:hypothetical protein